MNKITIVFLPIMLSASAWSAMGTFQPDGSAFVIQNSTSSQGGRTCAAEPALSLSKGPYDGRTGVRTTKFHVESRGTCSDEGDRIGMNMNHTSPLSITNDTDTCTTGFPDYVAELNSNFLNREAYDTMRYWYIPHCYLIALAPETAGALAGSATTTALTTMDSVIDFRNFIIHCLTLRGDDEWFCSFVADLAGTYRDSNNIYNGDYRAGRAIFQYLANNPRCAYVQSGDEFEAQQLFTTQYNLWNDTSHHPEKFDSTVPTLQQLGLDTVLEINAASDIVYPTQGPTIILDARLEGNPTDADGLLWLSIGREAYLHITVYDLLGRPVPNAGYNGTFEQGAREVHLGVTNAPSGTYYARIQTANNETQTLKLVKE